MSAGGAGGRERVTGAGLWALGLARGYADDADRDGVPDGCDCDASGDACSANATCDHGMDGVICNCSPGFVGDGETCSREGLDAGTPLDAGPDFDGGPLDGRPPDPGAVALLVDPSSTRATLLYATADGRVRSSAATTGAEIGRWTYATDMVDPSTDTAHVLFYDLAQLGATPPSYSNTDTYTVGAGFAHVTPLITRHP